MPFIDGMFWDEDKEAVVMVADGHISEDVQRDFDIIWDHCSDVCEVL